MELYGAEVLGMGTKSGAEVLGMGTKSRAEVLGMGTKSGAVLSRSTGYGH